MSHKVNAVLEEYNLETLLKAFEAMGWAIQDNTTARGIAGKHRYVAVNMLGHYDIGINLDQNGRVKLSHEAYLKGHNLGENFGLLKQKYEEVVAAQYARNKQGRVAKRTVLPKAVRLELEITIGLCPK